MLPHYSKARMSLDMDGTLDFVCFEMGIPDSLNNFCKIFKNTYLEMSKERAWSNFTFCPNLEVRCAKLSKFRIMPYCEIIVRGPNP